MRKLMIAMSLACALAVWGQNVTPKLEFVLDLDVALEGGMIDVGRVPEGQRTIIPITGGTFEGPAIRGTVVSGGADYQLHSATTQISHVNAIYSLRTDDGINIFIQNEGIISMGPAAPYFFTAPRFEAPVDSKYAWLNQSTYVCRPIGGNNGIKLRVWRVCDAMGRGDVAMPFMGIPERVLNTDAKQRGRVEEFTYQATIDGKTYDKHAQVYLPYGYNAKDKGKRYNVVYLMHGGGDDTKAFFADPRSPLPLTRVLDHLIADGTMDPVIVVTPTYYPDENPRTHDMGQTTELTRTFHRELHSALIPSLEMAYNTYLTSPDSIAATREHRAFGGFSMGSLCTWYQLAYGNDDVKHYIPLSGDVWLYDQDGNKLSLNAAAAWLNDQVAASGRDFVVHAYTGTDDIAYVPQHALFEGLRDNAPLFRINEPGGNAFFTVKPAGIHFYGDINQYLYEALPLLWGK